MFGDKWNNFIYFIHQFWGVTVYTSRVMCDVFCSVFQAGSFFVYIRVHSRFRNKTGNRMNGDD